MEDNPYDFSDDESRDYEAFLERARFEMLPKLMESEFAVSLCPVDPSKLDMKFSLELGCMIMLDKPIILVVEPGTKIPDHLVRVADEIVETSRSNVRAATDAIYAAMIRLNRRL